MSVKRSQRGVPAPRLLSSFLSSLLLIGIWTTLSIYIVVQPYSINAQELNKVRPIACEFIPEPGSPVEVTLAKTELDLDPFDAPLDARMYVTYRNVSGRGIDAVKFRIRFTDAQQQDRGTFHGPDGFPLSPGAERTARWKHEKIDPRTVGMKVRVLQVKFADGSIWQSSKMQELPSSQQGGSQQGGGQEGAASPSDNTGASQPAQSQPSGNSQPLFP